PAKSPTTRTGAAPAAESRPICQGVAPSSSAAISGRASVVTCEPRSEMAEAAQNLRNSRSRQRPPKESRGTSNTVLYHRPDPKKRRGTWGARDRGAPRVSRGATNVGGLGGGPEPPNQPRPRC